MSLKLGISAIARLETAGRFPGDFLEIAADGGRALAGAWAGADNLRHMTKGIGQ
jgi:hypothetical protein